MKKFIIPAALVLTPALAFAQDLSNVQRLLESIGRLVGIATPIVVGIALLGFFWGLLQYIFAGGDSDKQKEARGHMIWGIIGLFVMVAVWGLVRFVGQAVGITNEGGSINVPTVNGVNR